MRSFAALVVAIAFLVFAPSDAPLLSQATFTGPELLGRPTSDSITVNVVASTAIEAYFRYGIAPDSYIGQTSPVTAAANDPLEVVIGNLQGGTRYYYRMVYRPVGAVSWTVRDEHTFQTQRAPDATFTFTITADSHVNIVFGNASLYQQTLRNVANDRPDFHLDLGDTFAMDNVTTQAVARSAYLSQRSYMGLMSHSSPVFLVLGNHEQEEGWHLDDTGNPATSTPVLGANARKRYFLNPAPDAFYSGNADVVPWLDGDHLPEDYYAWQWGDALFVAIDPYWYSTVKPFIGNLGGGEGSDAGSGDRWDWTLGWTQYQWLKQTLEHSTAKYKFIFAHHATGGSDDYIRKGANGAHFTEWGGLNEDGVTNGFASRRPGWERPIHQLLVNNHVSAFFHAHDHEFAYEVRDGVVYQLMPMAADSSYGYGSFQLYHEADPYTERVLPNSGHLRVTVSPSNTTVDYVRAYLAGAGPNGQTAYSYRIEPAGPPDTTAPAISSVSATAASGGTATIAWATDEASDSRVTYGTSPESLGSSAGSAVLVTAHSVGLSGLASATTYYYRVASTDAAGNASTSPAGSPGSFTTPSVTTVTAFPASVTIQSGSFRSGNAANLAFDDNSYYELNASAFGFTRTASAYASVTGVSNGLTSLKVTYRGKNSQSCTQSIAIWRWTTNSWIQLDSRSVGTTEALLADLAPGGNLADFVSGSTGNGEVRVRVQCSRNTSFFASWDLLKVVYTAP